MLLCIAEKLCCEFIEVLQPIVNRKMLHVADHDVCACGWKNGIRDRNGLRYQVFFLLCSVGFKGFHTW